MQLRLQRRQTALPLTSAALTAGTHARAPQAGRHPHLAGAAKLLTPCLASRLWLAVQKVCSLSQRQQHPSRL